MIGHPSAPTEALALVGKALSEAASGTFSIERPWHSVPVAPLWHWQCAPGPGPRSKLLKVSTTTRSVGPLASGQGYHSARAQILMQVPHEK